VSDSKFPKVLNHRMETSNEKLSYMTLCSCDTLWSILIASQHYCALIWRARSTQAKPRYVMLRWFQESFLKRLLASATVLASICKRGSFPASTMQCNCVVTSFHCAKLFTPANLDIERRLEDVTQYSNTKLFNQ
jgi:hypothetical protein